MIHCIDCIHRKVCKYNSFTHPSQIIDGTCFDYKTCDVVPRSEVDYRLERLNAINEEKIKVEVFLAKQEVAREIVQILKDYAKSDDCLTYDASDKEQNELCEIHNLGVNEVKQSIRIIAMELEYKYTGEVTGND